MAVLSLEQRLAAYPELVQIFFPKQLELPEVQERLARASFPFRWVAENVIVAPPGSSRVFAGLTWSLTRSHELPCRPQRPAR